MIKTVIKLLLFVFAALFSLGIIFGDDEPAEKNIKVPPKPTASSGIYVQDYAGVISAPVQNYLQQLGRQLDQKTTAQLVVVTVKSLNGAPLEDYSLKLLRDWGIGNKEKNNGVLMLISTGDRKSRIEVGYGLEGALKDSLTGQIQDQYMIPHFRKGTFEAGIAYGYEALALRIAKEYNVQLAVSGYANHSPGTVKAGADGQSTDDLFNKALAEQNGTAVNGVSDSGEKQGLNSNTRTNVVPNADNSKPGTTGSGKPQQDSPYVQSNTLSGSSEASSPAKEKDETLPGFLRNIVKYLYETFGWLAIVLILIALDAVFLNGMITSLVFRILIAIFFSGGGGSGGGGYHGGRSSGGGFGGGSGGGGGSSRSW